MIGRSWPSPYVTRVTRATAESGEGYVGTATSAVSGGLVYRAAAPPPDAQLVPSCVKPDAKKIKASPQERRKQTLNPYTPAAAPFAASPRKVFSF